MLKTGAGSPENFLAYSDFDGTYDTGGQYYPALGDDQLHAYAPHVQDWQQGDPLWGLDERGKGIIGLINYYAEVGVNSQYFITLTYGGDGWDVFPWRDPTDLSVFDVSKLAQWERVFDHMDRKGVIKHMVLSEMENESIFEYLEGAPHFANSRKLYYREMVARFGHHLGLVWNLCEECGSDLNLVFKKVLPRQNPDSFLAKHVASRVPPRLALAIASPFVGGLAKQASLANWDWMTPTSPSQRLAFAKYISELDPYGHPIVAHHMPELEEEVFAEKLGVAHFSGISLQAHGDYASKTLEWINRSKASGTPWMVSVDEPLGAQYGTRPDAEDPNQDVPIDEVLWPTLLAGASGVEWYFGWQNNAPTSDLSSEDQRTRDTLWRRSAAIRGYFETHVPFWRMFGASELLEDSEKADCVQISKLKIMS